MQEVRPFIQLFRYDLDSRDFDKFEKIIMNTQNIQMVDWIEDSAIVAFICKTDHPEGIETIIEDCGTPKLAERRYQSVLTILGANDGTSSDREKAMRKAVEEDHEMTEWIREMYKKAQKNGVAVQEVEVSEDESDESEDRAD